MQKSPQTSHVKPAQNILLDVTFSNESLSLITKITFDQRLWSYQ